MYNFRKAEGKGRWNPAVYSHAALRGKQDLRCILELRPRTRTGKQPSPGLTVSGSGSDLAESASDVSGSTAAAAAAAAAGSSSSSSVLDNSRSSSRLQREDSQQQQQQQQQHEQQQQQDDSYVPPWNSRWEQGGGPEGGSTWGGSTQVRTTKS
jgi:hypothetical protein